ANAGRGRAVARSAERGRLGHRAPTRGSDRGDPRLDPGGGAAVRAPLRGLLRSRHPHRSQRGSEPIRGPGPRSRVWPRTGPRRRALAELLVRRSLADEAAAKADARSAGWPWPRQAAALACAEEDLGRLRPWLPLDALVTSVDGVGCVVFPDPQGPGRARELTR